MTPSTPPRLPPAEPSGPDVRVTWAFTGGLDLRPSTATSTAVGGHAGAPASGPRILLALRMYAISAGVGKARALARRCDRHDAYRRIPGGATVNAHTPSDFRRRHEAAVDAPLTESPGVLLHDGRLSLERVAQGGLRAGQRRAAAPPRRRPGGGRLAGADGDRRGQGDLQGGSRDRRARRRPGPPSPYCPPAGTISRHLREPAEREARALAL